MINIIVESGYNTSYITSVLISLFYNNTYLEDLLLNRCTNDNKFLYLQEYIKNEIISKIKENKTIFSDSINKIRIISHLLGWKSINNLFDEYNVKDFFYFLMHSFDGLSYNKTNEIAYLTIDAVDNSTVKTELDLYINNVFNNEINLTKIFPLLTININRTKHNGKIDIEKKIKMQYIICDNKLEIKWFFHSAICYNDKFYYSIIFINKKWFVFSDNYSPSFISIDMGNTKIINKIKSEIVLVFYKTDFY